MNNMFSSSDHTFVISAFGNSPYLEDCIDSICKQSVLTHFLITTATPSEYLRYVAQKYNCPLIVRDGKPNISDDWNYAYRQAKTRLITIAHQDDVYCSNYVETMLGRINSAHNPIIYFTNYGEIRNSKQLDRTRLLTAKRILCFPCKINNLSMRRFWKRLLLAFGNPVCCPSVTYVKEAIPNFCFCSGFRSNLDWDAWERLSKREGSFVYCDKIQMYHRVHEGSETSSCIVDDIRTNEDFEMLQRFWPRSIAGLINSVYSRAQKYNQG